MQIEISNEKIDLTLVLSISIIRWVYFTYSTFLVDLHIGIQGRRKV